MDPLCDPPTLSGERDLRPSDDSGGELRLADGGEGIRPPGEEIPGQGKNMVWMSKLDKRDSGRHLQGTSLRVSNRQ